MVEVGFIGLGIMGEPMALNLVRSGIPLVVWNRTAGKATSLSEAGARIAPTSADVFAAARVIFVMLADGEALDAVLCRGTADFRERVHGRVVVQTGTLSPGYSRSLADDIHSAGGHYVEAPVSGSRLPAESATLVGMLAGDPGIVDEVAPLFEPLCREVVRCGTVPNALLTKLAVNVFLISMVTGLAEAMTFATGHGIDASVVTAVLDAGPMSSEVSRAKLAKLAGSDFSAQASIADVLKNSRFIVDAARDARIAAPLLTASEALFAETVALDEGALDMIAVVHALEGRTSRLRSETGAAR